MGLFSLEKLFGITIRESANDGSDFTNPDADYRRLFLGEDGLLHLKDSAGTVTDIGAGGSGSITSSGYTQATARLLGRTTASTGAIEEITVGSGLSLSAGSLTATGGSAELLGLKVYTGGAGTPISTTSSTFADVDATNAAVTFTAPASGNVLVRTSAWIDCNASATAYFWGLREGTSDLAGSVTRVQRSDAPGQQYASVPMYVPSISGGSHTYKLSHAVASAGTAGRIIVSDGAVGTTGWGPLIIEVWAAP